MVPQIIFHSFCRYKSGDTRSLPRLTGSKLSLRPPTAPTSAVQSANNSSADESPVYAYKKVIGRNRPMQVSSRTTGSPRTSKTRAGNASESETDIVSSNELTLQLRKLGKYLEKKQSKAGQGYQIGQFIGKWLLLGSNCKIFFLTTKRNILLAQSRNLFRH